MSQNTAEQSGRPFRSLYRGRVGLGVIAAEVERPELAAMPLFEDEGWL